MAAQKDNDRNFYFKQSCSLSTDSTDCDFCYAAISKIADKCNMCGCNYDRNNIAFAILKHWSDTAKNYYTPKLIMLNETNKN